MAIRISVQTFETPGGVMARSPEFKLTGFGQSRQEAEESLMRILNAYISSLTRAGYLESALRNAGVIWERDEKGTQIEVRRNVPR